MLPDAFWIKRREHRLDRGGFGVRNLKTYEAQRQRFSFLAEIEEAQNDFVPGFNWRESQRDYAQGPTCVFLGTWLREYSSKLKPW
jgi:hypothetical protein